MDDCRRDWEERALANQIKKNAAVMVDDYYVSLVHGQGKQVEEPKLEQSINHLKNFAVTAKEQAS